MTLSRYDLTDEGAKQVAEGLELRSISRWLVYSAFFALSLFGLGAYLLGVGAAYILHWLGLL